LLKKVETSKRFLKRDYPKHLHVTCNGTVSHDSCINHCLPFAFGDCDKEHTSECGECNEIFNLFEELQLLLGDEQQEVLKELWEMLVYYLAHLTRKGYLNSQFNANLLQLNNDGILIIVDYKMRILPK
jgi:hypothetical protein